MFFRLTATLCAAIYGGMIIYGTDMPQSAETASVADATPPKAVADDKIVVSAPADAEPFVPDVTKRVDTPEIVAAAYATQANVTPVRFDTAAAVEVKQTRSESRITPPKDEAQGIRVVAVTGSRVNLRAAPSIGADVLDQLNEGEQAELLEVADGWMRIRTLASGEEGFMSADFLNEISPG